MILTLALLAAIAGAAIGFLLASLLGGAVAAAIGITSFEGASGYFSVFVFGPVGGIAGFITGLWLVLRYKGGHRTFSAIAGRGVLIVLAAAALVYGGIQLRLTTLENFPGGQNPQLDFEIRLPVNAAEPSRQGLDFEMQAGSQRSGGLLRDPWLRRDGDRYVLAGFVPLYTRTAQRFLVVSRPGEPKLVFQIRLSATPAASSEFGVWQRVDRIDATGPDTAPAQSAPAGAYEIRYRVPEWRNP